MTERSDADLADDGAERTTQQREGALADELASRHLAYRRALEHHTELVQAQLTRVQATAYVPESLPTTDNLPASYRSVREARELLEAARGALLRHRARRAGALVGDGE